MLRENVQNLLRDQINKELYSAYLYLDMSNWYYAQNLDGFGNWFFIQAREEQDHAMKILRYLQDNDAPVELQAIAAPSETYQGYGEPLQAALEHERYITSQIDAIYLAASEEKDLRTCKFIDWFIDEQGEEEKNASDLIGKYELFGDDAKSLYMLNAELLQRVYTPPVDNEA